MGNTNTSGYRQLKVYQEAHKLVLLVYKITRGFPKTELFGLISQMRRAAVSVVANIVEGWARKTKKEKLQFYITARASLTELEYYGCDLAIELGFISEKDRERFESQQKFVAHLLKGLINSLSLRLT